jgi:hypothetical protein
MTRHLLERLLNTRRTVTPGLNSIKHPVLCRQYELEWLIALNGSEFELTGGLSFYRLNEPADDKPKQDIPYIFFELV